MKSTLTFIVVAVISILVATEIHRPSASSAQSPADAKSHLTLATSSSTTPAADNGSTLPVSKSAILAALKARGFTIEAYKGKLQREGLSTYREKDAPAGIAFLERDGKLVVLFATLIRSGTKEEGNRAVDVVEALGEIVAGFTADEANRATELALVDLGKEPTERHRLLGYGNERTSARFFRMPNGDILISFLPVPKVGS